MRTNHLAVRIAGLLTFVLLITVAVLSSNRDSESSTAAVGSSARGHLAFADPFGPVNTSSAPTKLRLVSTAITKEKDELKKTFSAVYNVPVLTVSSQTRTNDPDAENELPTIEYTGASETIEMEFNRRPDGSPFRLAISEENPGSSGPSLQSSFWQAAVVAALQESDDLSGVRVTFSVPDGIDGPSAGGVAALSLLSAINQRELPDDFAFTGSILPDGTIGHIGGIVEKLRAAKEQGVSRMLIPTGMRLAEDMTTGELIDLKQLAAEFRIKLVPVRNLTAAYREIHRLPNDSQSNAGELRAKLPGAFESLLLRDCQKNLSEGDSIWEKIDEDVQGGMLAHPVSQGFLTAESARQALRAGQFCYASDQALLWGEFLKARKRNESFFEAYAKNVPAEGLYPTLSKEINRLKADVPTPETVLDQLATELSPITSQLFFNIYDAYGLARMVSQMDNQLRADFAEIEALKADDIPEGQTKEQLLFQTAVDSQTMQLLVAHFINQNLNGYHAIATRQGETLSGGPDWLLKLVGAPADVDVNRAQQVERFFYTAFRSIQTTFQTVVINSKAEAYDLPVANVLDFLVTYDSTLNYKIPVYEKIHQLHGALEDEGSDNALRFKATFNAHLCASSVAELSGIVVRWSELGAFVNDNDILVYKETSLLSQLIREARRNSIEKMNQCHEKGIPCVSSIWMFEGAEAGRDDPNADKVDVLTLYWQASLQAQALQMLFPLKKKP
tara:strand:- start:161 stop:2350 length:2190 start_codon:yes stop_codon:yes gene_type:complete